MSSIAGNFLCAAFSSFLIWIRFFPQRSLYNPCNWFCIPLFPFLGNLLIAVILLLFFTLPSSLVHPFLNILKPSFTRILFIPFVWTSMLFNPPYLFISSSCVFSFLCPSFPFSQFLFDPLHLFNSSSCVYLLSFLCPFPFHNFCLNPHSC